MSAQNVQRLNTAGGADLTIIEAPASRTVTDAELNSMFTNRGSVGAVVLTLPSAVGRKGRWVRVMGIVDETFGFTSAVSGQLISKNDASADSANMATAGDQIGSMIEAISDGTSWIVYPIAEGAVVFTVA